MVMIMRTLRSIWLPLTFTVSCLVMLWVNVIFAVPAILGMADVRSRYHDFVRLYTKGTAHRMRDRMKSSRCQRNACIAAAIDMDKMSKYYHSLGYRWYHLLPDGTFEIKNNPYLKVGFYTQLIGGSLKR